MDPARGEVALHHVRMMALLNELVREHGLQETVERTLGVGRWIGCPHSRFCSKLPTVRAQRCRRRRIKTKLGTRVGT